MQDLAQNLGISERTLYYSLKAYKKFPDLGKIPDGKNITWNKLITLYLPELKKEKEISPPKGYGITFNKIINWSDLLWNKIATKEL